MTKRVTRQTKQDRSSTQENPKLAAKAKTKSASTSSSAGTSRSSLATLLTGVIVVIALVIGGITGVDVLGLLGLSTPVAATTSAPTVAATTRPTTSAPTSATEVASVPSNVTSITVGQGFGAQKGFWQVYFTAPTGSRDTKTYTGGIENQLAAAIDKLQPGNTLDIVAFEFNLPVLTQAVLNAHKRGVKVRMVVDTEHALEDDDATTPELVKAGIPIVDDSRSAFMHNKFMILNGITVWTGSWNFTMNDTYRNNNNAVAIRSQRLVQNYQAEFNEMFEQKSFGPRSPANTPNSTFNQDGDAFQNYFSPEDKVLAPLITTLSSAKHSVKFMTFSFTDYDAAKALLDRSAAGVTVTGIFETTGSETDASELKTLRCAGIDARQDGNPFVLHHKVFIVDDSIIVTGSFNISSNATKSNDENLLIIQDTDLAAQYVAEFNRRWAESKTPTRITCQ